ncbi:ABC transporter substrate-binding protein [Roseomonas haemaphysalidis]|uniref:ABC transporter substrate-binding protein n=1 Tax=Roseomonas haemaphysalidis TaxID=2768162 RepID=A0ABS3KVC1_9PROT|nr:ABC transporter substrate-binding protein [Roseomonas haemaphysalidis]MBO1081428.1 ABC transporter substrate-binding protein [Roseomonas haemaphysalidis]
MAHDRRTLLKSAAVASLVPAVGLSVPARAQQPTLKVGVLNDQSGVYRENSGPTSTACVRQAVVDSGIAAKGVTVEVVQADHQNKPDVGSTIARQWIDRDGVDVIVDVPNSAVALAINGIVREKNKVFLNSGAGTTDLTGAQCSPNTVHWTYDTYMLAKGTGGAMVKAGGDSWFFITADYAFGHDLERNASRFVTEAGGKVLGAVRHPLASTDFSSYLLQAQRSRAKVIGLANAGTDTINSVKQAAEFGVTQRGTKIAVLLMFISDVHGLGLKAAQGLVCTATFYWDMNDRTRAFTKRVLPNITNNYPSMSHAGCYASVLHYLKAAADMGPAAAKASGADAVARMKAMPTDDDCFGAGTIRADGRKLHPAYLFEVKTPEESKAPWDYYKLVQTTPADQAFRPLSEGGCSLIRT